MLAYKPVTWIILAVAIPILLFFAAKSIAYNEYIKIRNFFYDNFYSAKYSINSFYGFTDKDIVILDIDNRSLQELGNFNRLWSRSNFGRVIGNIKNDGARAVFLDILFKGVISDYDNRVLVDSLKSAGNVFLGIYLIPDDNSKKKIPEMLNKNSFIDSINNNRVDFLSSGTVDFSYHDLIMSSESVGFTNCVPDNDGVLRHMPLLMLYRRLLYSSVSMQMWVHLNNLSHTDALFRNDGITYSDYFFIPTDRNCYVKVNYQGLKNAFKYYSFIDVFNNNYRKGLFKDKIVMIGSSSTFFKDFKKIPGGIVPGVQVHAATLSMLINENFVRVSNLYLELVIAILCGLSAAFFFRGRNPGRAFAGLFLLALSMVLLTFIVFYIFSYLVNLTLGFITLALYLAVVLLLNLFPEKKMKELIKNKDNFLEIVR